MKAVGWMVNLTMRRVEAVTAGESNMNRETYGMYKGPKRTYMLHDSQVFDTELDAIRSLYQRMNERLTKLETQVKKYNTEFESVRGVYMWLKSRGIGA